MMAGIAGLWSGPVRSQLEQQQIAPPNERLLTQEKHPVRATAAVPSADETRQVFGVDLYRENVQPVWLRVENLGDEPLWVLPYAIDEDYLLRGQIAQRLSGMDSLRAIDGAVWQSLPMIVTK